MADPLKRSCMHVLKTGNAYRNDNSYNIATRSLWLHLPLFLELSNMCNCMCICMKILMMIEVSKNAMQIVDL